MDYMSTHESLSTLSVCMEIAMAGLAMFLATAAGTMLAWKLTPISPSEWRRPLDIMEHEMMLRRIEWEAAAFNFEDDDRTMSARPRKTLRDRDTTEDTVPDRKLADTFAVSCVPIRAVGMVATRNTLVVS